MSRNLVTRHEPNFYMQLDSMSPRTIWLMLAPIGTNAIAQDSMSVLAALAHKFTTARALSPGTRPAPPDIDINKLIGVKWTTVRAALGHPDAPVDYDWECRAEQCQVYSYGADEREAERPAMVNARDLTSITVITGGPWVLILGVSRNTVTSVRWQGQK